MKFLQSIVRESLAPSIATQYKAQIPTPLAMPEFNANRKNSQNVVNKMIHIDTSRRHKASKHDPVTIQTEANKKNESPFHVATKANADNESTHSLTGESQSSQLDSGRNNKTSESVIISTSDQTKKKRSSRLSNLAQKSKAKTRGVITPEYLSVLQEREKASEEHSKSIKTNSNDTESVEVNRKIDASQDTTRTESKTLEAPLDGNENSNPKEIHVVKKETVEPVRSEPPLSSLAVADDERPAFYSQQSSAHTAPSSAITQSEVKIGQINIAIQSPNKSESTAKAKQSGSLSSLGLRGL